MEEVVMVVNGGGREREERESMINFVNSHLCVFCFILSHRKYSFFFLFSLSQSVCSFAVLIFHQSD